VNDKRCLSLEIRKDISDEGKRMAFQANAFSYKLCVKYQDCLDRKFDLNMALNKKAEMCQFGIQYETGQMDFTIPRECTFWWLIWWQWWFWKFGAMNSNLGLALVRNCLSIPYRI